MLGLLPKTSGQVEILGLPLENASPSEVRAIGRRCGAMFQQGALFSSLSVRENVEFPMHEYLDGSDRLFPRLRWRNFAWWIERGGRRKNARAISGGMTKPRRSPARWRSDPEIVFLDEPTSGLDPIAAGEFDALIRSLHEMLGLTLFMITHDLETLNAVCDRVAALHEGHIIADGPMPTLLQSDHPWLRAYFRGETWRAIQWAR